MTTVNTVEPPGKAGEIVVSFQPELLDPGKLDKIHHSAIDLVYEIGLLVKHEGILNRLIGLDGIHIQGQRVHFRADLVEKALAAMLFPSIPEDYSIISGAYIIGVQDSETEVIRRTTQKDLVNLLILGEQLGMCGSPPVRPLDLPEPLQEIAMYKAAWEYSSNRPEPLFDTTPMSTVNVAEVIYEMSQTIGKPFAVGMYLISPFTCPPEGLDLIAAFMDRQVPMWVGSMPIAGLTGPIYLLGAHVQALAELMAGITLLHVLTEGKVPVYWTPIDSVRAHPFDMRQVSFVYSSPEDVLGTLLQAQINARYGVPLVAKSLLTSAIHADEQAAAEKSAHTLAAALVGARSFTNGGFLANDEYVSPAQMVIDHEIVQWVRHLVQGLDTSPDAMGLEAIREVVGENGSFIKHSSTRRHYRDAMWEAPLFTHLPYKITQNGKYPSLWSRASQVAREHIAAGDYVLPETHRRQLERIYKKAAKELL